jgi:hypothetical protein
MKCFTCHGTGKTRILSALHPMVQCHRCKGSGEVPEIQKAWAETGLKLRSIRINGTPYFSLGELASQSGMSPEEVSECERGVRDPKDHPLYYKLNEGSEDAK